MGEIKKKCLLCDEEFIDIVKHISIRHEISSIGEYQRKAKEAEDKKIKIQAFLKYVKELKEKLRKRDISPEQLREFKAEWEKDNNLW